MTVPPRLAAPTAAATGGGRTSQPARRIREDPLQAARVAKMARDEPAAPTGGRPEIPPA